VIAFFNSAPAATLLREPNTALLNAGSSAKTLTDVFGIKTQEFEYVSNKVTYQCPLGILDTGVFLKVFLKPFAALFRLKFSANLQANWNTCMPSYVNNLLKHCKTYDAVGYIL
jgi:hypothetical protein